MEGNEQGVLRVVALDADHRDPDFFEYPDDLPDQADAPVWGVWEFVPGDVDEGDDDTWTEVVGGLTVKEAENAS